MRRFAAALLLILCGAMGVAGAVAATRSTRGSATLSQRLSAAYAKSTRLWPSPDHRDPAALATFLDRREVHTINSSSLHFVPRADTLSVRGEPSFDPHELAYSSFHVGTDTLRFTWGHMAEEFGGVPQMIVTSPGAPSRSFSLRPLDRWNVDAVWYVDNDLILACSSQTEGGDLPGQIFVWDLTTGRWFGTPVESHRSHRGFKLRNFFPEWQSAAAAVVGGVVFLKGSDRVLALDPKNGSWALATLDGRAIGPVPHQVARKLVPVTPAMTARLRTGLLAAFREWNREIDSVQILEVIQDPCTAQRDKAALLAMGLAPYQGSATQSTDIAATLNRQLFGIFVADSALTSIVAKVDMFPTISYLDYVVYFDLDAADDAIVVWGESQDYGGEGIQRGYRCGN